MLPAHQADCMRFETRYTRSGVKRQNKQEINSRLTRKFRQNATYNLVVLKSPEPNRTPKLDAMKPEISLGTICEYILQEELSPRSVPVIAVIGRRRSVGVLGHIFHFLHHDTRLLNGVKELACKFRNLVGDLSLDDALQHLHVSLPLLFSSLSLFVHATASTIPLPDP